MVEGPFGDGAQGVFLVHVELELQPRVELGLEGQHPLHVGAGYLEDPGAEGLLELDQLPEHVLVVVAGGAAQPQRELPFVLADDVGADDLVALVEEVHLEVLGVSVEELLQVRRVARVVQRPAARRLEVVAHDPVELLHVVRPFHDQPQAFAVLDLLLAGGVEARPDLVQGPGQVDVIVVGDVGPVVLPQERPDVVEAGLGLERDVVRGQLPDLGVDLVDDLAQVRFLALLLEPAVGGPHDQPQVRDQRLGGRGEDELHAPVRPEVQREQADQLRAPVDAVGQQPVRGIFFDDLQHLPPVEDGAIRSLVQEPVPDGAVFDQPDCHSLVFPPRYHMIVRPGRAAISS